MTREQIEKAAIRSADEELDDFECRAHRDGFIEGAQWRINSVWHDVSEQPEQDRCFIYEIRNGEYETDCIYKKEKLNWERYAVQLNMIRWVYLDDLLLEREEKIK